jgi:hypothetical protein
MGLMGYGNADMESKTIKSWLLQQQHMASELILADIE